MITLKKIQCNQLRRLLSPLLRIGSHGAAIWVKDSFTVEASTESITVKLRIHSSFFDLYDCSEPTRTWLNLHHLGRIFSSAAEDESIIMSALASANHLATIMYFVYEHHGTDTFTSETNLRGFVIPHHHQNINDSELSHQDAVGISSWEFSRILLHFAEQGTQFGDLLLAIFIGSLPGVPAKDDASGLLGVPDYTGYRLMSSGGAWEVEAHVTNGQVRFRSGFFEDIVLTTEGGVAVF
ncbi:hypothetical protein Acr_00g0020920 [Actinidia rufa]|uniref:Proliferating cell nuclear antigen PCNA N-terminal domain-containing protein n=1 Tax=Actinidia rufa TaxID=165716 RepID=A0A7J0DDH1_9ERIC|nr:hypothetical protein Acr_00g0020920 [Actinidia rufa]